MSTPTQQRTGLRFLDWVERVGNRLPDPVTLFIIGALLVLVGSHVAYLCGWSAEYVARTVEGGLEERTVHAKSLLVGEGQRWVWLNLITNFTSFRPLGIVLVCMLGIGVAERSGLLASVLRLMVNVTPRSTLVPVVLFVGILSSVAADAGYVVLPPLAALVFARFERSPVVGIAVVFAGVAAGFSANLIPTSLDPLLQSFTAEAATILDEQYRVNVLCNYTFMVVSTVILVGVGWAVTHFIVEPRYSAADIASQKEAMRAEGADFGESAMTAGERRGLWAALATLLLGSAGYALLLFVPGAPLHGEAVHAGRLQPIWPETIVPAMFILFLLPGVAYGIAAGTIKNDRDVATMMGRTMSGMGMYIVLAFFAGQFVKWFDESNLGRLVALSGIDVLRQMDLPPMGLLTVFILLMAFLNLFLGSASAKWALVAPVFVPLFMGVGISPELTQAAYRVGDSVTNPIAPLNPYLVVVLVYLQRCLPKAGLGSLIALMLPYSIVFLVVWTLLLLAYVGLGLPLGPESPSFIDPVGR